MKWAAAMAVVVLTGCDWILGLRGDFTHDAPYVADSETFFDAPPPGTVCIGAHYGVHLCFDEASLVPRTIGMDIDTDDPNCRTLLTNQLFACVYSATSLSITATIRATGGLPLVLVARDDVTIGGVVDVSSTSTAGAGANDSSCTTRNGATQLLTGVTAGGGPGGSFSGKGGDGGTGDNTTAFAAPGQSSVTTLRGGCPGGNGGLDFNSEGAGLGGWSGGAVYIASNKTITVSGSILATGAASTGTGNTPNGSPGGGGGGSGGMIVLDATSITLSGTSLLLAAGASGGGGGDSIYPGVGGSVPYGISRAPGGGTSAPSMAGPGGASSGTNSLDGLDGSPMVGTQGGAGGGGGGAGFIKLYSTSAQTNNGVVVPAAS